MIKVCNSVIVQEIEDPDAGEGLGHDVCDDRGRGGGIHGWLTELIRTKTLDVFRTEKLQNIIQAINNC
jgi:hypothetical protein